MTAASVSSDAALRRCAAGDGAGEGVSDGEEGCGNGDSDDGDNGSEDGDSLSNTQFALSSPRANCLMQSRMFPNFSMSSCLKFPNSITPPPSPDRAPQVVRAPPPVAPPPAPAPAPLPVNAGAPASIPVHQHGGSSSRMPTKREVGTDDSYGLFARDPMDDEEPDEEECKRSSSADSPEALHLRCGGGGGGRGGGEGDAGEDGGDTDPGGDSNIGSNQGSEGEYSDVDGEQLAALATPDQLDNK